MVCATFPAFISLRIVGARRGGDPAHPVDALEVFPDARPGEHATVPTSTTRLSPKRLRILSTWAATVLGSLVEPSNTWTATGQPAAVHSTPNTICRLPRLPSRLWPGEVLDQLAYRGTRSSSMRRSVAP